MISTLWVEMEVAAKRPMVLVTNDDGVESYFLHALVEALVARSFEVWVAVPELEQSWIGRAMSRRRPVIVGEWEGFGARGWKIGGTPTDCVNLAMGHLLNRRPEMVISGINIGYNTGLPLLYSSGTVAGALEGAVWGVPALAVSQAVHGSIFDRVSENFGQDAGEGGPALLAGARRTAEWVEYFLKNKSEEASPDLCVYNLNLPLGMSDSTPIVETVPARLGPVCLYEKAESIGSYQFAYSSGVVGEPKELTDREVVLAGKASLSVLNFSLLGQSKQHSFNLNS